MNLFNVPFTDIQLRLNSSGIPIEVLIQPEIFTRWMNLREGELKKNLTDNSVISIIEGADKDFSDSLQAIKDSLFYQFSFAFCLLENDLRNPYIKLSYSHNYIKVKNSQLS